MKRNSKLFFVLVLASGLAHAAPDASTKILCEGGTNFGDHLKLELRLSGSCEGNAGGETVYCQAKLKLLDEVDGTPAGSATYLFVETPEKRLVFRNGMMPQFYWEGTVIDLLSQATPLAQYKDFAFDLNFGGGRTWGSGKCNVAR